MSYNAGTKGILTIAPNAGGFSSIIDATGLSADRTITLPNSSGTLGFGSGDFVGPSSSTDNAIVRFDSTTGKLGQNSAVTIADTTGIITVPASSGITSLGRLNLLSGGNGADIYIIGADATTSGSVGGRVEIDGGTGGASSAAGGEIYIHGGMGGTTAGNGGDIRLQPGFPTGGGTFGKLKFVNSAGFNAIMDLASVASTDKTFTFPNLTGTFILGGTGTTDNAIPRADGTTSGLLQSSGITIDDSNNLTTAGVIVAGAGSVTAVTYGRDTNAGTGMYFTSSVAVGIAANGTQRALINATGLTVTGKVISTGVMQTPDGTKTLPAYGFTSSNSSGLFWDAAAHEVSITAENTLIMSLVASDPTITFWNNAGKRAIFQLASILADATFTFPNQTGTIALTTGQTYSVSNVTTDRTYNANSTTIDELADVLGTLISDLRSAGIVL